MTIRPPANGLPVSRSDAAAIGTANATAAAALFEVWIRAGVRHVIVAPGSRSTPLALAAAERAERGDLEVEVVIDERSAAFVALGIGLETSIPAVVVCTSGTAAVNFAPAVVEAGLSNVPMIVATADRPPELRGRGAPQTIDQVDLYGGSVRLFADVMPPDDVGVQHWIVAASRAMSAAAWGPAHLNLCFREPLLGEPTDLEIDDVSLDSAPNPNPRPVPVPSEFREATRGIILAGGRSFVEPSKVVELAERLQWPILADPLSGLRSDSHSVTAADSLLRSNEFADAHLVDLVVRVGRPPASKVVNQWIRSSGFPVLQVGGPGLVDPDHNVVAVVDIDELADSLAGAVGSQWLARWRRQNEIAEATISATLDAQSVLTEPMVARIVAESIGADERLVVASSMPVRDLEWFGGPAAVAHSNRGANGIDGVISTGLGTALAGPATTVLIGDLAAIHDSNALVGSRSRSVDLTIVVNDNDGGGIFSFLPQAEALPRQRFEMLFGTPTGTDLAELARSHGAEVVVATTAEELRGHLDRRGGVRVVVVPSDRSVNVEVHRHIHEAVVAAIERR